MMLKDERHQISWCHLDLSISHCHKCGCDVIEWMCGWQNGFGMSEQPQNVLRCLKYNIGYIDDMGGESWNFMRKVTKCHLPRLSRLPTFWIQSSKLTQPKHYSMWHSKLRSDTKFGLEQKWMVLDMANMFLMSIDGKCILLWSYFNCEITVWVYGSGFEESRQLSQPKHCIHMTLQM